MFLFMYSHFHRNSLSHVCKILVIVSGKIKINYKKKKFTKHRPTNGTVRKRHKNTHTHTFKGKNTIKVQQPAFSS